MAAYVPFFLALAVFPMAIASRSQRFRRPVAFAQVSAALILAVMALSGAAPFYAGLLLAMIGGGAALRTLWSAQATQNE